MVCAPVSTLKLHAPDGGSPPVPPVTTLGFGRFACHAPQVPSVAAKRTASVFTM